MNKNSSIAFIGNLFHKKTLSQRFFLDILTSYFDTIDYYYGLPRNDLAEIDFDEIISKGYDTVILYQVMPTKEILQRLSSSNIVFVPMYDYVGGRSLQEWEDYKPYKFINFSKTLHKRLESISIDSLYVQYAPTVQKDESAFKEKGKYRVFFWQRKNEITWNTVKTLLNPEQIESIHIHKAIDPGTDFVEPSAEEISLYNITFSDWFETQEEYKQKVAASDVFIAPRLFEGIGMSFLEAMAMGKCVIAPDFPTMNEYITHNQNGILYDIKMLKRVDLSHASALGREAKKCIAEIYENWQTDKQAILDFITKEQRSEEACVHGTVERRMGAMGFIKKLFTGNKNGRRRREQKMLEKTATKTQRNDQSKKKYLIIFPHNPFLRQNGVQSRFYGLLEYFHNKNALIDILSHENFVDKWDEASLNHDLVRNVYLHDFKKAKMQHVLQRKDEVLQNFAFASMKEQLDELILSNGYDGVLVSYVHWAELVKNLPESVIKYITIEDFISLNNFDRNGGDYDVGQSISEEIRRINHFDKAICISHEEMNFFERVCKGVEFHHIPHFLESHFDGEAEKTTDIIFVGSDNPFNRDGMVWFMENVVPNLKKQYRIKIVGRVNEHLEAYSGKYENIEFVEYAESLDDLYRSSKISICPLQGGTGLKIKVVESLAYGVPVVTTKYGVVGMDTRHTGCWIEDDAAKFAQAIDVMLDNEQVYTHYVDDAVQYFANHFSRQSVYEKLDKVFFA
jgi:glycosyltransferase involved in cell wall biosynthesis